MMRSRLNEEQHKAVKPLVNDRTVYDLGAGPGLPMSSVLIEMGAYRVMAIDKEPMTDPPSRVRTFQRRFDEYERFPEDGDVAFVSWPVNRPNPGLVRMLDAAPIIVYVGKNTDGSACGDRLLFEMFMGRKLLEYVPDRENVLIVYGEKSPVPRDLVGEEYAALQSEMLSYSQAEWRTATPGNRRARKDALIEELHGMLPSDRAEILAMLKRQGVE